MKPVGRFSQIDSNMSKSEFRPTYDAMRCRMKLYNFTNHEQNDQADFFKQYGFDEVTEPMHPEITPEMNEEQVVEAVKAALPKDLKDKHFLVQGMSNVCHYAVIFIHEGGGKAYYIYTLRQLDAEGRFVFVPVDLQEYAKV